MCVAMLTLMMGYFIDYASFFKIFFDLVVSFLHCLLFAYCWICLDGICVSILNLDDIFRDCQFIYVTSKWLARGCLLLCKIYGHEE